MRSLQLEHGNAEQIDNPWSSRSNDEDSSPSTATARNRQQGDADPAFRSDPLVSSGLTTWRDRYTMILAAPQSTQPALAQPPMQETDTNPADPRIASLKAIFPDFDDTVILSVLESTNYDEDRALDVLLGMNDPSFIPPTQPPAQSPDQFQTVPSHNAQSLSQEALDEQLARRLALEEQQAVAQAWQPQEGQIMYQPYQPRRGRSGQPQNQPQTQGQGGTMTDFQEGFSRIAESGKKTFSSIVSKVKAKMQEFDQGQGRTGSQNSAEQPSQPAPSTYSGYLSYTPGEQYGSGQNAYTQPYQSTQSPNPQRQTSQSQPAWINTQQSAPPRSGVSRPAATEPARSATPPQSSYYDPNGQGYDLYSDDEDIQLFDKTTPSAPVSDTVQTPATPLHTDSSATPPPPSDTSSPPSYASPVTPPLNSVLTSASPPARSLSPTATSGVRGTTPGAPGAVDFSKLGLLPKRPISLVRPQSPPVASAGVSAPRVAASHSESTTADSADKEEAEFVENPFEDGR